MSDVKVIWHLLANSAPLTAEVAQANIEAGAIPQGTVMPAIGIMHISGVWNSEISKQGDLCTARVQVTVLAPNYPKQKQIMDLVRAAVPRTRGTINGVVVGSILRLGDGPDFRNDEVGIFMQTQDFLVKFVG